MPRHLTKLVNDISGPRFEWARERDRELIEGWMKADHPEMSADFFLEPKTESMMFGDEEGDLLAVRMSRVMRLDIQFNTDPAARDRLKACLLKEFPWMTEQARKAGFRQLIFDSISKPLIAFCMRRFRFKASPDEFIAGI